jgi:hypothetical protein
MDERGLREGSRAAAGGANESGVAFNECHAYLLRIAPAHSTKALVARELKLDRLRVHAELTSALIRGYVESDGHGRYRVKGSA